MVRQYEGNNTFKVSWDKMVRAFWCRYPNPESKHVLTEDVTDRFIDASGRLWSKRLMSKTNPCPKWAEKFISARSLYVVEESVVDPKAKTLTTYTRNISCKNYMTIDEKVVYKVSKEESGWTIAERTAWIASSYGYGLSRAVEAFGLDRFKKNVKKANQGFQIVLDALYCLKEGTDHDSILTSNLFHPWLKARALREKAAQFQAAAKVSPIMTAAAMSSET